MTRRRGLARPAIVIAATALAVALGGTAIAQDAVPITGVDVDDHPEVVVEFTLPPSFTGALSPDELTVTEDGSARPFTLERQAADNVDVVVSIDTSGSMSGTPIEQAKLAAQGFVDQLPSDTRVALIGFGNEPLVLADFTDKAGVIAAIEAIRVDPAAETSLYDAVRLAVQQFPPTADGPRYVLVLTDGGDTISEASIGTAQSAVQAAEVPVFAVSLVTSESDPDALEALTAETGGGVVEAADPDGLADLTNQIAGAIGVQYAATYQSTANGRTTIGLELERDAIRAIGEIGVDMPLELTAAPTTQPTPTAIPTPTPTPGPEPVATVVVDGDDRDWLLPIGIASMALAMVVLFNYLLWPRRRRRNPLRDVAPVAGAAIKNSGGLLASASQSLVKRAENFVRERDHEGVLAARLDRAGIRMRPAEFLVLVVMAAVVAGLIGLVFSGALGLLLSAGAVGIAFLVLSVLGDRRAAAFEGQMASTLQMMSGALRAGFSISQVVDLVSRESSSPTREEFARLAVEENLGRDISDSFRDVATRMQSEDFGWVAEAIDINRSVGGDLAEVLENVSQTMRNRQAVVREIKTLSAEGRLSAVILIAVPFVIAAGQFAINPELSAELTGTGEGRALIVIGLVMIGIGAAWMRRITRLSY